MDVHPNVDVVSAAEEWVKHMPQCSMKPNLVTYTDGIRFLVLLPGTIGQCYAAPHFAVPHV